MFEEFDLDGSEIDGERLVGVHTEAFLKANLEHYEAALAGESREFRFAYRGRQFRCHTIPVRADDGRVVSGVAMSQDITALHEREAALQRRRDELAMLDEVRSATDAATGDTTGNLGPGLTALGVVIAIIAALLAAVVGATRWYA